MDPNAKPNFDFSSAPAGGSPAFSSGAPAPPPSFGGPGAPAQEGEIVPADNIDHGGYKGIHPIAALFHVVFKVSAILVYILGTTLGLKYVVMLIVTILLLAADFWTTKNITGRILVSMRWRSEVQEDGTTQWMFESSPEADQRVNAYDNWFFWVTLAGNFVTWVVLLILNIFTFKYLPIKVAAVLLSGANLYGYFKCRRDAQQRLTSFMISQATSRPQTAGRVASFFMSSAAGGSSGAGVPAAKA